VRTLTNIASVKMDQYDPTPADNSATVTTDVSPTMARAGTGCQGQPTVLVLRFDESLDAGWAQDPRNYRIVALQGSLRTIRVKSAVYHAATHTVILRPAQNLNVHKIFQLTVMGAGAHGVTDTAGSLAGGQNGRGGPDGNFSTFISAANLVLKTKNPRILREYKWILSYQSSELKHLQFE
jgi:hypothetical protein